MKRLLVVIALLALTAPAALAVPPAGKGNSETGATTTSASATGQSPAALCKEQLTTMGAVTFRSTYAPTGNGKNAFGKCVSGQKLEANENAANAAKDCKKERMDLGADEFADKYGTNANKKNAFGKCVSGKVKEETEEDQQDTLNAAKDCKHERSLGAQAFADKYGTNANKKNAFGKCVSGKVKAGDSEDDD